MCPAENYTLSFSLGGKKFAWRQKGDYDDLFDFDEKTVLPYLEPVKELIGKISALIEEHLDKTL